MHVGAASGARAAEKAIILRFCAKSHRNCLIDGDRWPRAWRQFHKEAGVKKSSKHKEWRVRPLIPRVLSCQRHGWPSISTWRCRQALAAYPKASDEQSSNAFCLALLPMRLAMRPTVTSGPVVSYTAVSPLPCFHTAVCFLWHFPCLTADRRYRSFCPMVSGLSSAFFLQRTSHLPFR